MYVDENCCLVSELMCDFGIECVCVVGKYVCGAETFDGVASAGAFAFG